MGLRRGFTLMELLVLLCCLVLVLALLAPAVARARKDASDQACRNNLRKLGAAVLAYEEAHGHVPPSALDDKGTRRGWLTFVLPQLGEERLARQFRVDVDWFDPVNAAVIATPLDVVGCPSAPARRLTSGTTDGVNWRGAVGDYAAVESLDGSVLSSGLVGADFDRAGLFRDRRTTRLVDVTDGLSTVLMLVEDAGRRGG